MTSYRNRPLSEDGFKQQNDDPDMLYPEAEEYALEYDLNYGNNPVAYKRAYEAFDPEANTQPSYGIRYDVHDSNGGSYKGRGPQGYQRSDERIEEDINDDLTWHDDIDATHIQVTVNNGHVILEGTVREPREQQLAAEIAEAVNGVRNVRNLLIVGDVNSQEENEETDLTWQEYIEPIQE